MKKIGILTFHATTNYGAVLQCYALQEFLKNNTTTPVVVINYIELRPLLFYLKHLLLSRHCIPNVRKVINFIRFIRDNLDLTYPIFSRRALVDYSKHLHLSLSGSDEVWNFRSFRSFNKAYLLDFCKSCTLASYAASSGPLSFPSLYLDQIKSR